MINTEEEEQKKIEERNKKRILLEEQDLQNVLSQAAGRRVLARLMYKACAIDENMDLVETSFSTNTASGNFTEGSRRFGILIFNEIMRVSPQAMIQMRNEAKANNKQ